MSNTIETGVDPQVTSPSMRGESGTSGEHLKEKVSQKAHAAGAAVKETTQQVTAKAKEMTREAAEGLKTQSKEFAQSRKSQLGDRIKGGGSAIRRAAEKLQSEDDPNLAHYAQMVAERVERAGDYIHSKDVREIRRDLENAARSRPELVFGAMFVAGLAIARFLKASSPNDYNQPNYPADYTGSSRAMETEQPFANQTPTNVEPIVPQTPYSPASGTL